MKTVRTAHWMIFILLLATIILYPLLGAWSLPVMLLGGQIAVLLLPVIVYLWRSGERVTDRLGLRPCRLSDCVIGLGLMVLLQPFLIIYVAWLAKALGNPLQETVAQVMQYPLWFGFMGLALIPAVVEELVFRGFLLGSYRELRPIVRIVLCGILFGMFHMNLYQFSYAVIIGICLSLVTERAGSVLPAILMHSFNNGFDLSSTYFGKLPFFSWIQSVSGFLTSPGIGMWEGFLIAAASLAITLFLTLRWYRGKAPESEPRMLWFGDSPFGATLFLFIALAIVLPLSNQG